MTTDCHQCDQKAHTAGVDGIVYLTPKSKELVNNGTIRKSVIQADVKRFNRTMKRQMNKVQHKVGVCWNTLRDESNDMMDKDLMCFFMEKFNNRILDPVGHALRAILLRQELGRCPSGYMKRLQEGISNVKFLKCLTQNDENTQALMSLLAPGGGWGVHVELGFGASFGYYYQASNGIAFGKNGITITSTTCHGVKLDISAGIGISVSFLPDMNDLLGTALTIEMGFDLPGTEAGFDVLLHFAYGDNGLPNKFIGFGFALGMGFGVVPLDLAASYCNTVKRANFPFSTGQAILHLPGQDAINGNSWVCSARLLGVTIQNKTCCPESNRAQGCTGEYCWFEGTKCPRSPAEIAGKVQDRPGSHDSTSLRYSMEYIIKRTVCPNLQTFQPHRVSLKKCTALFDRQARKGKQKYMIFRGDVKECWFSNTYSVSTCSWTPSHVSKLTFKMVPRRGHWYPHGEPYEWESQKIHSNPNTGGSRDKPRTPGTSGKPENDGGSSGETNTGTKRQLPLWWKRG